MTQGKHADVRRLGSSCLVYRALDRIFDACVGSMFCREVCWGEAYALYTVSRVVDEPLLVEPAELTDDRFQPGQVKCLYHHQALASHSRLPPT